MDELSNSLLPYVINAFSSVYGEEYRSIISKKLNNAIIVLYHDVEGLSEYISYLKRCKAREFSIRFLDEIGIDVQKYKKNNYTEPLDSNLTKILDCLINANFGFSKDVDYWSPLRAFDTNNKTYPEKILENKIKIVNYLLDNKGEQITEKNFEFFAKTKEFSELLKKIDYLKVVYEKLLFEYNDWVTQFMPYEKYVEDEKKRKEGILQKKKNELFRQIFDQLPSVLKDSISNKSFEEQLITILGGMDISAKSIIESFHYDQMEKLKSSEVDIYDKFWIIYWQSTYLKSLGITIPNEDILKCASEDIINFLSFLGQDDIRKYIPSDEVISYISSTREKKYEEALREYYTTRNDFIDAMENFNNNHNNVETIYDNIKNKRVCILGESCTNINNEFMSLMFYTIRENDGGYLFYTFMHENGHIIDQSQKGCGFETFDDFCGNYKINPYDNAFRKYEKFNETLNDIFTQEAVKFLQDQGIYLLEPEEFTKLDNSNVNTAAITKRLLQPLVQKFRQQVIKAKINTDPAELIMYIGEDNFEELVDAVNKVDYLSRNGVVFKIDKFPEDAMVIEYLKQVERVKQIYINIDTYYANKFGNLLADEFEERDKKR